MQGALVVLKLKRISSPARSGAPFCGSGEFSDLLPESRVPIAGTWKLYRSHIPSSKNAPTSVEKERKWQDEELDRDTACDLTWADGELCCGHDGRSWRVDRLQEGDQTGKMSKQKDVISSTRTPHQNRKST